MPRRGLILLILAALTAIVVSPRASAQQEKILVTLFGTHKSLSQLVIDGPLEVMQPSPRRLPFQSLRFVALGGTVRARAGTGTAAGGTGTARGGAGAARGGTDTAGTAVFSAQHIVLHGSGNRTTIRIDSQNQRSYTGTILLSNVQGKLTVQNLVNARDYIKSVVGSESLPEFPPEALKAQSVLAQTLLARYKLGDYLNDTTETQAYLGRDCVTSAVSQAVDDSWGQRLEFNGRPIRVYFHSTCAGGTSDGEAYFALDKGSAPYLRGTVCNYCQRSPFWAVKTASIPRSVWTKSMGEGAPAVVSGDNRGRPLQVRMGRRTLSGYDFWMKVGQRLGWDKVPGSRFQLNSQPNALVLTSTGAGHGVGLCQWGACELARMGKSYDEILRFYFPGAVVQKLSHVASPAPSANAQQTKPTLK